MTEWAVGYVNRGVHRGAQGTPDHCTNIAGSLSYSKLLFCLLNYKHIKCESFVAMLPKKLTNYESYKMSISDSLRIVY